MTDTERGQFTFYASFAQALKRLRDDAVRCAAYDVIVDYALYGVKPDMETLPDAVAIAFELIRPNLDASRRKAVSGQRGGLSDASESNAEQTESKTQANRKQSASKKENENEKENEKEIENESEKETSASRRAGELLDDYTTRLKKLKSEGYFDTKAASSHPKSSVKINSKEGNPDEIDSG